MSLAYLGFGSNIGNCDKNIARAISILRTQYKIQFLQISSIISTKPYGLTDQPDFKNCVAKIQTDLSPIALLDACLSTEILMKRVRKIKWGPRNIDVDILFFDNLILSSTTLTIPHPEITKREFVLTSLNEIAPNLIHPNCKISINKLLMSLLKS